MPLSYYIHISGQVQGVGFRPHVYNLATEHGIRGYVSNNEKGVIILAQGDESRVSGFYSELLGNPPPLARIRDTTWRKDLPSPWKDFAYFLPGCRTS